MNGTTEKKYFAFISYKREDEEWAKWLQHKLEHYKLPSNLNGRTDLPKEIRPIFRDQSDLAGGVLADEINKALESSKYLIVICSPRAAQSEWVGKEVQTFLDLGRVDKIIPFIIGGTAYAQESKDECFPLALRELPSHQELLGVNINEMGRDAAAVKVVAQMFGLKFDELWQRHEREQRKRRNWIIAASTFGFIIMAGVAFWMYVQRQDTLNANMRVLGNHSLYVVEKAKTILDEDSYLARMLAVEVLPKNLDDPNRPYRAEAEAFFRDALLFNSTIFRDNWNVNSVAFSPDGKRVLSSNSHGKTKIWNFETGKELRTLPGEYASYRSNGRSIVSSYDHDYSPDGTIYAIKNYVLIKDAHTLETLYRLEGPSSWDGYSTYFCRSMACSPNGNIAAAYVEFDDNLINDASCIVVWEKDQILSHNYRPNRIIDLNKDEIWSVAFSPEGEHIVSASDNAICIWDAKTCERLQSLEGEAGSVCYSPDGKYIVSTSWTAQIWDAESGEKKQVLDGHSGFVNSASYSPDGKFIVTASNDSTVCLWNVETGSKLRTFVGHTGKVNSAIFSPDGKCIVSASDDETVRVWDINTNGENPVKSIYLPYYYYAFSDDGELVVSTEGNIIELWGSKSGEKLQEFIGHTNSWIESIAFSSDKQCLVSAALDSTIQIWDITSGAALHVFKEENDFPREVVFSKDGKHIANVAGSEVHVWDVMSEKIVQCIDGIGRWNTLGSVCFSPDNKHILINSDWYVGAWDIKKGTELWSYQKTCIFSFTAAVFSPSGKYIANSDCDSIHVFEAASGKILKTWKGGDEKEIMYSISFSPDDKKLVTTSDKTIRVWDTETGIELWKVKIPHSVLFSSAHFSSDGRQIIYISDHVIYYYDFPPLQELINQTRKRFKDRPLTPEERRMYYLE